LEQIKSLLVDKFHLTDQEWNLIRNKISVNTYSKGDFLITQGEQSNLTGFIISGIMRYFCYDARGNDPTGFFTYENQYIIDPFSFRNQTMATLNLQAVMVCTVGIITFEDDAELMVSMPRWLDISNTLVFEQSLHFADQKKMISMNATDRYAYFCTHYPSLANRAPLQYIASYLGIKQPSLSRLRKQNRIRK
jgi:CRP-like cAMP-binding protein